jgi:hypothetical protein
VRSRSEIKAAEEIAQRTPCEDFGEFKPVFDKVQSQLESGERQTLKYQDNAEIKQGDLFILDGQKVMVAAMDKAFVSDYGWQDRRLRVVYDNATESDLLLRSLQCDRQYTIPNRINTEFPLAKPTIADDAVLERIYIDRRFKNDTERLEKRFELYTSTQNAPKKY